jgi:hypothetical protein
VFFFFAGDRFQRNHLFLEVQMDKVNWLMRMIACLFAVLTIMASDAPAVRADGYDAKPKLVVVLVFD